MFQMFANQITAGLILEGEPIYTVVNHPSGIAFLDFEGALISGGHKDSDILNVEMW